ncbi:MAG TPA: NAD(P)H-dependent oxidoreductase subunit E [Longimicrobiales bacterium]|nr:NAD(P)H-dependent oxidoreductase subunit E [Longimicrobiales bacterium]
MAERRDWAGERGDFARLSEAEVRGESYVGERPLDGGVPGSACSYPYMLEEKQPEAPLFEGAYQARFEKIMSRYPERGGALLPVLNLAQEVRGWLSPESMDRVAELLELSPMYVRGVATFYTMYNKRPVGRHLIQVCTNVCCNICGADDVMAAFVEATGAEPGEISGDGLFTVIEAECLGACGFPTAVQINSRYYENVGAADVPSILDDLRARDARAVPGWKPDIPLHEVAKDPATARLPDAVEAGRGERRAPRDGGPK